MTKLMGKEIVKYWFVDSFSNEGKRYKVCQLEDGSFTCSCPEWIFRRKECKHIQQIKRHLEMGNDFGLIAFKDRWILQPIKDDDVKLLKKEIDKNKREIRYFVGVPLIRIEPFDFKNAEKWYSQLISLGVPKSVIKEYWRWLK